MQFHCANQRTYQNGASYRWPSRHTRSSSCKHEPKFGPGVVNVKATEKPMFSTGPPSDQVGAIISAIWTTAPISLRSFGGRRSVRLSASGVAGPVPQMVYRNQDNTARLFFEHNACTFPAARFRQKTHTLILRMRAASRLFCVALQVKSGTSFDEYEGL